MSSKDFTRGLVVGKFAPLHHGHELIIRHALERCSSVVVISYSKPELPGCEPEKRERWLAELFPSTQRLVVTDALLASQLPDLRVPENAADERTHRRFVGKLCRDILRCEIDAVFTSEDYGDGFAAELTSYFREFNPRAVQVSHVQVDRPRQQVPTSGTAIRENVHAMRHYLSPAVYSSFVERICFLGGESSGKSTLTAALASYFKTSHVTEYGRELWEVRAGVLHPEDMVHIAEVQIAREDEAAAHANRFLFCDTSPLTTLFYARELFGQADPRLESLADRRYSLAVLCAPDFPFSQDGTRRDAAFRERQHAWYLDQLTSSTQPWLQVAGPVRERLRTVVDALRRSERAPGA